MEWGVMWLATWTKEFFSPFAATGRRGGQPDHLETEIITENLRDG